MDTDTDRVIGIMPAAGHARRLGRPHAAKELLPVYPDPERAGEPLPVCFRLLHAFREADIREAIAVLRADKADLRERLEEEPPAGIAVRVIALDESPSPAYSVAVGTRAAGDATVALGFPDVLWQGRNAFRRLRRRLAEGADAALGLFPQAEDYPTHGVELDAVGRVEALRDPPAPGRPAWTLAVWRPALSRWLEAAVEARYELGAQAAPARELDLTEVLRAALAAGFRIDGVAISDRPFLDVGDPARLAEARRRAELAAP